MTKTPIRWIVNTGQLNSWDVLKVLALICMIIDHTGALLFPEHPWFRVVGRGAMPIFLFLTGFAPHYRWSWTIFGAGVIVAASEVLHGESLLPLNILFTILACRMFLLAIEKGKIVFKEVLLWPFLAILFWPTALIVDYGTPALLFALFGYMQRYPKKYSPQIRIAFLSMTALIKIVGFGLSLSFDESHMIGNAILVTLICVMLYRFRVTPVKLPIILHAPIWTLSRLALYIYVIHLIVLRAIA